MKPRSPTKSSAPKAPKKPKRKDNPKAQSERFIEAAREHGCELDEAAFDEALKKVFPPKN